MPTSVRLDAKTESLVARLARRKGQTKSKVIRDAIHAFAKTETAVREFESAYEALKPWIGCVRGGPPDLSSRTGEKFARMLRERKRP
ncbi:MAG: ribbon-helix-helix protein, CopG family [Candidatus Rokubacteria bacterium]|jgi:predicted DNA-binding protein|nr:ribbon-helix-helix protein, CopG family [Candidatus Rokubacteria bacterium]